LVCDGKGERLGRGPEKGGPNKPKSVEEEQTRDIRGYTKGKQKREGNSSRTVGRGYGGARGKVVLKKTCWIALGMKCGRPLKNKKTDLRDRKWARRLNKRGELKKGGEGAVKRKEETKNINVGGVKKSIGGGEERITEEVLMKKLGGKKTTETTKKGGGKNWGKRKGEVIRGWDIKKGIKVGKKEKAVKGGEKKKGNGEKRAHVHEQKK